MKFYLLRALKIFCALIILCCAKNLHAKVIVKDSLRQIAIKKTVKELQQTIINTNGGFLKDEARMLNAIYGLEVSQTLSHLAKKFNKKLYVVTFSGPDLAFNKKEEIDKLPALLNQEANNLAKAIYDEVLFDAQSILLLLYCPKISVLDYEFNDNLVGVSYTCQNSSLFINDGDLSTIVNRGIQFETGNDALRAILYPIIRILSQSTTNIENTNQGLNAFADSFLQDYDSTNDALIAVDIVIPSSWGNGIRNTSLLPSGVKYGFTPSGKAFDISQFSDIAYHNEKGYVSAFIFNNIIYQVFVTSQGGRNAFFWGYYPKKDIEDIRKKYMVENGFPTPERWYNRDVEAFNGSRVTLLDSVFLSEKWFALEKSTVGGIAILKKNNEAYSDLGLTDICKTQYLLTLKKDYPLDAAKRGVGLILDEIPEINQASADDSDCKDEKIIQDAIANGLKKGKGAEIYAYRYALVKTDPEKVKLLIEYANKISDFLENEYVALVRFESKFRESGNFYTLYDTQIVDILKKMSYETFKKSFPVSFDARDANYNHVHKVLASYNPWLEDKQVGKRLVKKIPENYNINSRDHRSDDVNAKYQYSIQDLVERYKFCSSQESDIFKIAIENAEKLGSAFPLSMKDNYEQYVKMFETDSAWWAWTAFVADALGSIQQGVAMCLKEISGKIVDLTNSVKIPEHWWNPDCGKGESKCVCNSNYSPVIENLFGLIGDTVQRKKYQKAFAFVAGIYNAVLDEFADKASQVNLLARYYSDTKETDAILQYIDQLIQQGLWEVVKTEFANATCNEFKVTYTLGYHLLSIIGVGKGIASFVSDLRRNGMTRLLFRGLLKIKPTVKNLNNRLSQATAKVVRNARGAFDIVITKTSTGVKTVIASLDNQAFKVKQWINKKRTPQQADLIYSKDGQDYYLIDDGSEMVGIYSPRHDKILEDIYGRQKKHFQTEFEKLTPDEQFKFMDEFSAMDDVQRANLTRDIYADVEAGKPNIVGTWKALSHIDLPFKKNYLDKIHNWRRNGCKQGEIIYKQAGGKIKGYIEGESSPLLEIEADKYTIKGGPGGDITIGINEKYAVIGRIDDVNYFIDRGVYFTDGLRGAAQTQRLGPNILKRDKDWTPELNNDWMETNLLAYEKIKMVSNRRTAYTKQDSNGNTISTVTSGEVKLIEESGIFNIRNNTNNTILYTRK